MKIGILTQPLQTNYGGLLQAWALQQTIAEMGHEVTIVNRVYGKSKLRPLWRRALSRIKNEILIRIGKRQRFIPVSHDLILLSEQNVAKFRDSRYLGVSPNLISNESLLDYISRMKFDAFVVGSDQVWRPKYSPRLMTYFLDFAKYNDKVKKIAYAASFGVDQWEFTKEQTEQAARLAPLFDVITVRESSAIRLVKQYFNCDASLVLDPTLLLPKEKYLSLVENPTCPVHDSDGQLFCYILDNTPEIENTRRMCSSATGYKSYFCNYSTPHWKLIEGQNIEECIVPPVEQWIKSFADAEMIITDSFHGCAFSIIFNKPFWVVTNIDRGGARFASLLTLFNLQDRIVSDSSLIDWNAPIDWSRVNQIRADYEQFSLSILSENL